jgi:thioredoxin-related protein
MKGVVYILLLMVVFAFGSRSRKGQVHFISPGQLEASMRKDPKPILVYYHTDWCKYCTVMDKGTFENRKVADSINKYYYAVKFNPETKDSFTFFGRVYKYIEAEKYHEFKYVFDSIYAYPSVTFLDKRMELLETSVGYYKPKEFLTFVNTYKN